MKIFKYNFQPNAVPNGFHIIEIDMPPEAYILKCLKQGPGLTLWAMVEPSEEACKHKIGIAGTGLTDLIENELQASYYLDTVIDGDYVWHIWDMGS